MNRLCTRREAGGLKLDLKILRVNEKSGLGSNGSTLPERTNGRRKKRRDVSENKRGNIRVDSSRGNYAVCARVQDAEIG